MRLYSKNTGSQESGACPIPVSYVPCKNISKRYLAARPRPFTGDLVLR